jgi:hypothetical protein
MSRVVDSVIKYVQDEINEENEIPKDWVVYRRDKAGKPTGLYAPKKSSVETIEFVQFKCPIDGDVSYWSVLDFDTRLHKLSGHLTVREACIMAVRFCISRYMTLIANEEDVLRSMTKD